MHKHYGHGNDTKGRQGQSHNTHGDASHTQSDTAAASFDTRHYVLLFFRRRLGYSWWSQGTLGPPNTGCVCWLPAQLLVRLRRAAETTTRHATKIWAHVKHCMGPPHFDSLLFTHFAERLRESRKKSCAKNQADLTPTEVFRKLEISRISFLAMTI